MTNLQSDHIIGARYVAPSQVFLQFADGFSGTWPADTLQLNTNGILLETVKPLASATAIEIKSSRGEAVSIDSSALRYLIDPEYAAKIDKSISDLHMTPAEQEEAARLSELTRDPRWYDVGDEDDLFE